MKTVSLYPNPKRDENFVSTRRLAELLGNMGHRVLIADTLKDAFSGERELIRFVPEGELFTRGDVLIPLGGDGTILSVAKRAAEADIPVLGVNLGKIGFMAGLEKKDLEKISRFRPEDFSVSERMMLSCRVNGENELCALNEIVIAPEKGFHIVEMSLKANRRRLSDFRADGLIFNTPTGSTGYAFSAGGAVTDAELDSIGVKTVSSYMLIGAHHMIFRPETRFTVEKLRTEDGRITVCADGRDCVFVKEGDILTVERSLRRLKLCFLSKKSNLEVFFRKF